MELNPKARLFVNLLQDELPLTERPYRELGRQAGLTEDEAVTLIGRLKSEQVLRQISAIFDTSSLGYHSSLVACQAPPARTDAVAAVINQHPGVSHNYARTGVFNLWFTLAVSPASSLAAHVGALERVSGAQAMRLLPNLRLFKIGMKLDMTEGESQDARPHSLPKTKTPASRNRISTATCTPLTPRDIAFIRALQEDMEVRPDPYAPLAAHLGVSGAELFAWCRATHIAGRLRRIAGVLNHRHAGFASNAMGVWQVPETRVNAIGELFAAQKEVTHCYLRPVYPDWPYNLYTMVHGRTKAACEELLAGLSRRAGISDYRTLYSSKEYKKTRLRYFTGEIEAWEAANFRF